MKNLRAKLGFSSNKPWFLSSPIDNVVPSLWFDFKNNRYAAGGSIIEFSDFMTLTRSTTATYTSANGDILMSGIDEPRIDHSFGRGGLLIEPESENLFLNSHDLSTISGKLNSGTGSSPVINRLPISVEAVILPDIGVSGGTSGKGFTCVGMCMDDDFLYIGNIGKPLAAEPAEGAQIVTVYREDPSVLSDIIDVTYQMQGVAKVGDVFYYIRPSAALYSIGVDGSDETEIVSGLSGSNGVCYDTLRGTLWISLGTEIHEYTTSGTATGLMFDTGEDIDQLSYEPVYDRIVATYGGSGSDGSVLFWDISEGRKVREYTLKDGYSIEGICVDGTDLVVCFDGYYHSQDGVPVPNQFNQVIGYKFEYFLDTTPANLFEFDITGYSSASDYSLSQITISQSVDDFCMTMYVKSYDLSDYSFLFRHTTAGYSKPTASQNWSRVEYIDTGTTYATSVIQIGLMGGVYDSGDAVALFWGAAMQVEDSAYPTSYIPTYGVSLSRSADYCVMTGLDSKPWFDDSVFTIYFEAITREVGSTNPFVFQIDSGSSSNRVLSRFNSLSAFQTFSFVSSAVQATLNTGTLQSTPEFTKTAAVFKENDFAVSTDGQTTATDTSGLLASGFSTLIIGSERVNREINGVISDFRIYPSRVSNNSLETATA